METTDQDDAELAAKIIHAMKEYDAADATRKAKALAAGKLLAEAQKRHPTEKAFANFLQLAGGIQIRRARDLIALALGRKDFEQHQADNAAAQQRHRDKLKAERIERELREQEGEAARPRPDPRLEPKEEPEPEPALRNAAAKLSAAALQAFKKACRTYLPAMSNEDVAKASRYMDSGAWIPKKSSNKEAA